MEGLKEIPLNPHALFNAPISAITSDCMRFPGPRDPKEFMATWVAVAMSEFARRPPEDRHRLIILNTVEMMESNLAAIQAELRRPNLPEKDRAMLEHDLVACRENVAAGAKLIAGLSA